MKNGMFNVTRHTSDPCRWKFILLWFRNDCKKDSYFVWPIIQHFQVNHDWIVSVSFCCSSSAANASHYLLSWGHPHRCRIVALHICACYWPNRLFRSRRHAVTSYHLANDSTWRIRRLLMLFRYTTTSWRARLTRRHQRNFASARKTTESQCG